MPTKTRGIEFEKYDYSPGAFEPLPHHMHPEYQFTISANASGEYLYRGSSLQFAPLTLAAIHSGEKHAPNRGLEASKLLLNIY